LLSVTCCFAVSVEVRYLVFFVFLESVALILEFSSGQLAE